MLTAGALLRSGSRNESAGARSQAAVTLAVISLERIVSIKLIDRLLRSFRGDAVTVGPASPMRALRGTDSSD